MRSALVACLLAPELVTACGREDGADDADESGAPIPDAEDACASAVPVRLAAPPPGWKPSEDALAYRVQAADSQLLFRWGSPGTGPAQSYLIDPCGGPSQALDLLAEFFAAIDTPAGPRLYGFSGSDLFLVDRLDEPGLDVPRSIGHVQSGGRIIGGSYGRLSVQMGMSSRPPLPAAGLGARTWEIYVHEGEPLAPLRRAFGGFIEVVRGGADEPLLVLFDSGELRSIDLDTGEDVLVQSSVRYAQSAPDARTYVWQELGDGVAEAVHLVDVESGAQRTIGVNDFVDRSWGAESHPWMAGRWWWTADGRHLGLIGPEMMLVTVADIDTGAAVEIPQHARFYPTYPAGFHLILDDAGERFDALWDPATDELFEFHRGEPAVHPVVWRVTDDAVYYTLDAEEASFENFVPLWKTDRATGERSEVTPRLGNTGVHWLADGRALSRIDLGDGRNDILLIDLEAAQTTVLASGANQLFHIDAERGVYYLDVRGEQPGLWLAPIPPR